MASSDLTRVKRFFERGIYFLNEKKYPDANLNFKDALQIMPQFLPARTHLAVSLIQEHKYVEAIKLLEDGKKIVELRKDELIEVNSLLGNICLMRQDYRAALYYFKAAYKIDPESAVLRHKLASCQCKAGNYYDGLSLMLKNAQSMK